MGRAVPIQRLLLYHQAHVSGAGTALIQPYTHFAGPTKFFPHQWYEGMGAWQLWTPVVVSESLAGCPPCRPCSVPIRRGGSAHYLHITLRVFRHAGLGRCPFEGGLTKIGRVCCSVPIRGEANQNR